jgi:hypothetical protein
MKVAAGGQTFWSGYTVLSSPPMILKLASAALPSEAGTMARIHVGPMSGCEVAFKDNCTAFHAGFCPVDGGSAPPF